MLHELTPIDTEKTDTLNMLRIQYIKVSDLVYWDNNPKLHDIGSIVQSIKEYGFRDPPAWDNALQALVEGNGRTEALKTMMDDGDDVPKGVAIDSESKEWCIPVIFGLDSESKIQAEKYAVDHNNLTMLGGDFSLFDVNRMWNNESYRMLIQGFVDSDDMPVSFDMADARLMLDGYDIEFGVLLDDESDDDGDHEDDQSITFPVIEVVVQNYNLTRDVQDAIQTLLQEHSEWDAYINKE